MANFTFVDPRDCTIKLVGVDGHEGFLPKVKELIGTNELGHCIPIQGPRGIICGNFHDDWGLSRQFYGILLKGYPHPIMGPSCFYAEDHTTPEQPLCDFNYRFIPGENLRWIMKDPATMTYIHRPKDHVPPEDPHAHMI